MDGEKKVNMSKIGYCGLIIIILTFFMWCVAFFIPSSPEMVGIFIVVGFFLLLFSLALFCIDASRAQRTSPKIDTTNPC
jgi:drug/metabolite transporter (DMT)-like permease